MLAFSKIGQQAVGKRLYPFKTESAYRFCIFATWQEPPKLGATTAVSRGHETLVAKQS
jgi:hypothetical protein